MIKIMRLFLTSKELSLAIACEMHVYIDKHYNVVVTDRKSQTVIKLSIFGK